MLKILRTAVVLNAIAFGLAFLIAPTAEAANLVTANIGSNTTPTLAAASGGGDAFVNDGRTFLMVTNGGGGSINVTLVVQRANVKVPGAGTVVFTSIVTAVPNGTTRFIAVPTGPYNDANGRVQVTYSGVTSVTVGAFRVPPGL